MSIAVAKAARRGLRAVAPWLTNAVASRVLTGAALASLCASRGTIAMLEMLQADTDLRTRFDRGRTILHIAVRERQAISVIWLLENNYTDLLHQRSSNGETPLHEAIAAGDTFIVEYILRMGGAASEHPDGNTWDARALSSENEEMRSIARAHRGVHAV